MGNHTVENAESFLFFCWKRVAEPSVCGGRTSIGCKSRSRELMYVGATGTFVLLKLLLLLLPTAYLRLQNRRFGKGQIFKSQILFIYAGSQTTVDDR